MGRPPPSRPSSQKFNPPGDGSEPAQEGDFSAFMPLMSSMSDAELATLVNSLPPTAVAGLLSTVVPPNLSTLPPTPLAQAQEIEPLFRTRDHLTYLSDRLAQATRDVENGQSRFIRISMPPRSGKQVADSVAVLTTQGWTTHGQLQVGDQVFAPSGRPVTVRAVSEPSDEKVLVTFTDGETVTVHPHHEWSVYDRARGAWRVMETQEIARRVLWPRGRRNTRGSRVVIQLPQIQPLQFPEKSLPIDPYTFGVWLGDGTTTSATICGAHEDLDHILARIPYELGARWIQKGTGVHYQYIKGGLRTALKELGVFGCKFIPADYLLSSEVQRRALLAGLVDTDGTLDKTNRVHISSSSLRLTLDIQALVRSLGYRVGVHRNEADTRDRPIRGGEYWTVSWTQVDGTAPGTLPRKAKTRVGVKRRIGFASVEPAPPEPGRCIQVDGSMYLVGRSLIPTHNSTLTSLYFPAWLLRQHPQWKIGVISHGGTFATTWGRGVRRLIENNPLGVTLAPDISSASEWETTEGGGMLARGISGDITGRGFKCVTGPTLVLTDRGYMTAQAAYNSFADPDSPRPAAPIHSMWAFNHATSVAGLYRVVAASHSRRSDIVEITTSSGRSLRVTSDHPVYSDSEGRYLPACDLTPGTALKALVPEPTNPDEVTEDSVTSVRRLVRGSVGPDVYDFEIEEVHNFFADGVLVHNCLLMDDVVKGFMEAHSEVSRDAVWSKWVSDIYSRLEPPFLAIAIGTRWHSDDLLGRLGSGEYEGDPADWEVIEFPAIAEANDVLGRLPGEPLISPLLDETPAQASARWRTVKESVGSYAWACTPAETPITMADWTTKPISQVRVGDMVMGFRKGRNGSRRMYLEPTVVQHVMSKSGTVNRVTLDSGDVIRCTEDHRWYTGRNGENKEKDRHGVLRERKEYAPVTVGTRVLRFYPKQPDVTPQRQRDLDWVSGMFDGEGYLGRSGGGVCIAQSPDANPEVFLEIRATLERLGWDYREEVRERAEMNPNWGRHGAFLIRDPRQAFTELLNNGRMAKGAHAAQRLWMSPGRPCRSRDKVVSIEPDGDETVYALTTGTGNYVAWGYASSNSLYQQRPAPAKGAIFDIDWWRYWTLDPDKATSDGRIVYFDPDLYPTARWLDSWDCAFKATTSSDFVVGQRWVRTGPDRYLIAQTRARRTFTDTLAAMRLWSNATLDPTQPLPTVGTGQPHSTLTEPTPPYSAYVHERLVEDKANGTAIIDTLRRTVSGLIPVNPTESKQARARAVTPECESGNVFLPNPSDPGNEWVIDLLDELRGFPTGSQHDDQVDALTQALSRLRDGGRGSVMVPGRVTSMPTIRGLGRTPSSIVPTRVPSRIANAFTRTRPLPK